MKKIFAILTVMALTVSAAVAQPGYGRGGYSGGGPGRPGYGHGKDHARIGRYDRNWYGGIKFGLVGSHIYDRSGELKATGVKSGISLGAAAGFNISPMSAFESGLYYVEKGGIGKVDGEKVTYELNYLEIPLMLKFNIFSRNRAVFQPYAGGYLGMGIGGDVKDYRDKYYASSFNDTDLFRRGDSGLLFGCGVSWNFLHANLGYELGLSDISRNRLSDRRNRALVFSVGFAF